MPKNKLSLQETHPQVADQWHPTKNGDLTPAEVLPYSRKKVWWKCSKGSDREWPAIVKNRIRGAGCKYCRSLVYLYPERAKEWHPMKNEDLKPAQIMVGANRRIMNGALFLGVERAREEVVLVAMFYLDRRLNYN